MSPTFAPTHDVYCVSCKLSSAMCPYGMRPLGGIWYCYGCLPEIAPRTPETPVELG